MNRYSKIENKIRREIVLLKGSPCRWGRCRFCDYIEDNSTDLEANIRINNEILNNVTGEYGILEVINSGNVFELPRKTRERVREIIREKKIHTLFVEAHWVYRKKIPEMRSFFGVKVVVKTGLETFDTNFRERVLVKGFGDPSIKEIKTNFDSVCLMVGVEGQTKEMIRRDIRLAREYFDHFTVNLYVENGTSIKPDPELKKWFCREYTDLEKDRKCDLLINNTDFGVGD